MLTVRCFQIKGLHEIEKRALAISIQALDVLLAPDFRFLVLGHRFRQVTIHATRTIVGRMHARAGHGLVEVHQVLALAEAVQEHRHRADIESVRSEPHQVIQDAGDLVEHDADILGANGHLDTQQFLDRQNVAVLVTHHGNVVEPVHVTDALAERFRLGQFLGGTMQQADVRVCLLNNLAFQLQHQAEHTVRRRMLRTEVHRVALDLSHLPNPSGPPNSDCHRGSLAAPACAVRC
jgi:hypothetical protein